MKIGILTFHWATNYGAVLQAYALQSYLTKKGYDVCIIDYKPKRFENSFLNFIRQAKYLKPSKYLEEHHKEKELNKFRRYRFTLSKHYYNYSSLKRNVSCYDVIISGSDQVLNPYFLLNGEGNGKVTTTYFLDFPFNGKRIGYALSFGCTCYPTNAMPLAKEIIKSFDAIGVREETGISIVQSMGRKDAQWVPDPTLLMPSEFYKEMINTNPIVSKSDYLYCFFIRNIEERKLELSSIPTNLVQLWNNDDNKYSMEDWFGKIYNSKFVITDSFHCLIMCLKLQKDFAVMTNCRGMEGMNDRIFTILDKLSLTGRIANSASDITTIINLDIINWEQVDSRLSNLSKIGEEFLDRNIRL